MRLISHLKRVLLPKGIRPRTVLSGPYQGIHINVDLQNNAQLWLGTFERELAPWLKQFATGIRSGIDVGAAHGEYTLFMLAKTEAVKVLAFEPDRDCFAAFRANLALNGFLDSARLSVCCAPVGDDSAAGDLSLDGLGVPLDGPCLVKIDVEGHEASVLRSCPRLLDSDDTRLIVETHGKSAEQDCLAILEKAGYVTKVIEQSWWRTFLPEHRPLVHNHWLVAQKNNEHNLAELIQ